MATVYLHIGAPKTATSTLQRILSENHKKLLNSGVLYPRELRHGDAHHLLVCDLVDKYQRNPMPDVWYGSRPRGQAWPALLAEMARHEHGIDKVILSTELFFGQSGKIGEMLEEVARHLQGHDIRVVAYLRRQDRLYSSFFNQDVKGIRQWPHCAYQFYETHQLFQLDYYQFLAIWSGVFGRESILIRPYEAAQWVQGDIVRDFCALTGIPPLAGGSEEHNEGLGVNQLYIKRCLNRVGYGKELNEQVLQLLLQLCPEQPSRDTIYVNQRLYAKYRQEWLRTNDLLAREYLQGEPLFREPLPAPEETLPCAVDGDRVLAFVSAMSGVLGRRENAPYRPLFARAALLMLTEQSLWERLKAPVRESLLQWV